MNKTNLISPLIERINFMWTPKRLLKNIQTRVKNSSLPSFLLISQLEEHAPNSYPCYKPLPHQMYPHCYQSNKHKQDLAVPPHSSITDSFPLLVLIKAIWLKFGCTDCLNLLSSSVSYDILWFSQTFDSLHILFPLSRMPFLSSSLNRVIL